MRHRRAANGAFPIVREGEGERQQNRACAQQRVSPLDRDNRDARIR
jgi:hypothetical protein